MYLTQAIQDFEGHRHEMVGLFSAEAVMQKSRMTLGYREFHITRTCILGEPGTRIRGHEFHYSLMVAHGRPQYAGSMIDAGGHGRGDEGLLVGNAMALYTHLHFGSQPSGHDMTDRPDHKTRMQRLKAAVDRRHWGWPYAVLAMA
jgi:cobyrinic acid a,c-diamide synthase